MRFLGQIQGVGVPHWELSCLSHRLIEEGRQSMHPEVGLGLGPPKQQTVHVLGAGLLEIDQDNQQLGFQGGQRTVLIRAVATLRMRPAVEGVVLDIGVEGAPKVRQQGLELLEGISRQCQETLGILRYLAVGDHGSSFRQAVEEQSYVKSPAMSPQIGRMSIPGIKKDVLLNSPQDSEKD